MEAGGPNGQLKAVWCPNEWTNPLSNGGELNGPFDNVFRRQIRHSCEEEGGLVGAR